jgi:hypothetical protein
MPDLTNKEKRTLKRLLQMGSGAEIAHRLAAHSNAKTTGRYDPRSDDVSVGEVEKIGI